MTPSNGMRRYGAIGVVAALASVATVGLLSINLPPWLVSELQKYGPVSFFFLAVAGGFKYYVPRETVPSFIQSQKDVAVSMARVADQLQIMSGQAGQLSEIKETLSEILIHQHVNGERLKIIEMRLGNERSANDT